MNRRKFLKGLVLAGIATTTSLSGFAEVTPKLKEYPEIKYTVNYLPDKSVYLHSVELKKGDTVWYEYIYTDEKELPIEHYEAMVDNVINAGLLS